MLSATPHMLYIKITGLQMALKSVNKELWSRVSVGRAFQTVGAATAKPRIANVVEQP